MSVSFEDFLESASVLLQNKESKEIDFRNLISRSYYALFHLSQEKVNELNLPISIENDEYNKLGSHEQIFIKFQKHDNKYLRLLGEQMNRYKKARRKADYDIHEHIVRSEAFQHFHAVKDLIKKLQQLKENP